MRYNKCNWIFHFIIWGYKKIDQKTKVINALFSVEHAFIKDRIGALVDTATKSVIANDKEMADILNQYFCSVFTKERTTHIPEVEEMVMDKTLETITITEEKVYKKLESLKVGKTLGSDGICSTVLKEVIDVICKPLQLIYQESLNNSFMPNDWNNANVIPLFEKESKGNKTNYRLVSMTIQICKIVESIIKDEVIQHLQKKNLLNSSQHGFSKGKSCLTYLLMFLEDVTKCLILRP